MQRNLGSGLPSERIALYDEGNPAEQLRDLAHVGRLWASLRARWKLFCIVAGGFAAAVIVATLLVHKSYTATAKMIVGGAQSEADAQQRYTSLPVLNALALQSSDLSADTVAELVQEGPVVDKVIQTLGLTESPAQLLSSISVKPVLNTAILSLRAASKTPAQAAAIANAFASVFVERERDLVSSQAVAAQQYLQTAIGQAQSRLQRANGALTAYQSTAQIADITTQTQALLARVEATESKTAELQDDLKQAQAQLASARSQLANLPPSISGQRSTDVNPAATQLQSQLAQTDVSLATAHKRYTDKHPAVIALEQQRDQLERQIAALPSTVAGNVIAIPNPVYEQLAQQAATLQGQIQGDAAQIVQLQRQRKALGPQIAALPARAAKLGFLQERAKLASDVYNALEQKYDDAVVAANSAISDVTVVQPATASDVTVTPNLYLNAAAGVVIGILLGLLAVAIVDAVQRRIREDGDVERITSLPVIGHIPDLATADQRALPWITTITVEAFLHLCTSLRMRAGRASQVIVITSPEKGDGKSTIAYHVASAMARIRRRVLLLDADLRMPTAHLQAKVDNLRGIADVLSGECTLKNAVRSVTPSFDVLPARKGIPSPVGLLDSPAFDQLLADARAEYDCIIIDTPALAPVVDSIIVAARADATALVLSANGSHERSASEAVERFRALGIDNVVGIILNRTKVKLSDYSDYFTVSQPALPPPPEPEAEREDAAVARSVTIVVPAYNEGPSLEGNLEALMQAFDQCASRGPIQYIVVDDGSTDQTPQAIERATSGRTDVLVLRHERNRGLGAALRTARIHATGALVLTVDSDLSYAIPDLMELLHVAEASNADLVLASAYMKGGRVRGVPWLRAFLSREANRFLSMAAKGSYATLTCMVRVYRRELLEKLSFDVSGMDVNADLAFQAMRAGAAIVEVPSTLAWPERRKRSAGRASPRAIASLTWRTLCCGLRQRPALVLSIPGLIPGLLPAVVVVMLLLHCSPRAIAIGSAGTMIVQYGSLALFGTQALSFIARRRSQSRSTSRTAPYAPQPR